jgi:hypothetical protein
LAKQIKVKGIRRDPFNTEQYAFLLWIAAKSALREKREREAREKAKRRRGRDDEQ